MKVSVVSSKHNVFEELSEKLEGTASLSIHAKDTTSGEINEKNTDIVFLCDLEQDKEALAQLAVSNPNMVIVFNAVAMTIEETLGLGVSPDKLIGMNLLPTFINRDLAEVTTVKSETLQILKDLGWNPRQVGSRIGLVSPRVIFMIINEAYYTVQEGTASKSDIDTGMKLGTNYPKGPFEWLSLIGIENVYRSLEVLYEDTREGRYKICPLLKQEMLKAGLQV